MKVAVILPSRGLIFSQTADEILQNLKNLPHKFFFSHKRPVPACFEIPVTQALEDESITHLWLIEEDMVLKPGTLKKMLKADKDVVTYDYPVSKDGQGAVVSDLEGNVLFCGTGCLLVKKDVLSKLKKPYFTTDVHWTIQNHGDYIYMGASDLSDISKYGTHDVNFGMKLYKAGIPITVLRGKLGQRKLISLGKSGSNDGAHNIETWTKVRKDYFLNEIRRFPPLPASKLVSVDTPTGTIETNESHAKTLVDKGLGKLSEKKSVVINFGEVEL